MTAAIQYTNIYNEKLSMFWQLYIYMYVCVCVCVCVCVYVCMCVCRVIDIINVAVFLPADPK